MTGVPTSTAAAPSGPTTIAQTIIITTLSPEAYQPSAETLHLSIGVALGAALGQAWADAADDNFPGVSRFGLTVGVVSAAAALTAGENNPVFSDEKIPLAVFGVGGGIYLFADSVGRSRIG